MKTLLNLRKLNITNPSLRAAYQRVSRYIGNKFSRYVCIDDAGSEYVEFHWEKCGDDADSETYKVYPEMVEYRREWNTSPRSCEEYEDAMSIDDFVELHSK